MSPRPLPLTRSFVAYVSFACLVIAPISVYFYVFHGDWFLLYLIDVNRIPSAIAMVGAGRFGSAVSPLVRILGRPDPLGRQRSLRLKAIASLAEIGDVTALNEFSQYFRPWFSPVATEERRAAFDSLRHYPRSEIDDWLKKGRRTPDARIREICREIAGEVL